MLLALAVSCSQSGSQETSSEPVLKASEVTMEAAAPTVGTMQAETIQESDTVVVADTVMPTVPEAYSKFNLDLIDDDSVAEADADSTAEEEVIPDTTDSNKYRQAYHTGISFGAVRKSRSTKEHFSDIILQNEQKGDASSAAIMVAGKYFKMLQMFADKNKDEKRLKQAIDGLDNLRGYINEALQSNKDVSTNILLQKISDNAMACRSVYEKCNADYDGQTDKYRALADTIHVMQKNLFAE